MMPSSFSWYDDADAVGRAAAEGRHREVVGGLWDEIGRLQVDFLVSQGLRPEHKIVDIGCGALRGGVHLVRYLDSGNYFGFDLNGPLLDAGYLREVQPAGLEPKLPRQNLSQISDFDARAFGISFDFALAFSVFTHVPLNTIRVCLERIQQVMKPGGRFFATIFAIPSDCPSWLPADHDPGGIRTFGDRDPFHYRPHDMRFAAESLPWQVEYVGDFGHPRDQKMVLFTRLRNEKGRVR